jgi:hypothetical protein
MVRRRRCPTRDVLYVMKLMSRAWAEAARRGIDVNDRASARAIVELAAELQREG